ncbi:MAG: DUF3417 domain-containing protein, partial [Acidobacteriaceae bacterium]
TSGMKVLVNGGLNLSELDGWWAEAYLPEVGWTIGDGEEHGEDPAWDAADAEELYSLLEREVITQFYERDEAGLPSKWLGRVRESMARLTPKFAASRTIREYTEGYYVPAASRYRERASEESAVGASLTQWRQNITRHWNTVHFGAVEPQMQDGRHFFRVQVFLGELMPEELRVEFYADPIHGGVPALEVMTVSKASENSTGAQTYSAEIPATRPASDYTARIHPYQANAALPLEASEILWQR